MRPNFFCIILLKHKRVRLVTSFLTNIRRIDPVWVITAVVWILILLTQGFPYSDSASLLWDARKSADAFWSGHWWVILSPQGMRASLADNFITWVAICFKSDFIVFKVCQSIALFGHSWVIYRWARTNGAPAAWILLAPLALMSQTQLLRESFFVPLLIASVVFKKKGVQAGCLLALSFAVRPIECLLFTPLLWMFEKDFSWSDKKVILKVASLGAILWILFSAKQMSRWLAFNLLTKPVAWELFSGHASNPLAVWGIVAGIDWLLLFCSFMVSIFKKKCWPKNELLILVGMVLFMLIRSQMTNPILRFYGVPSIILCLLIWRSFSFNLALSRLAQQILITVRATLVVVALVYPSSSRLLGVVIGHNKLNWEERAYPLLLELPDDDKVVEWSTVMLYPQSSLVPLLDPHHLNLVARSLGLSHRFKNHRGDQTPSGKWIAGPFPGHKAMTT
jgi:hypothetical protein